MTDENKRQVPAPPTWLDNNRRHFADLQATLQHLDSQLDSLPPTFNPKVFLQFIRGAVNEVVRLTQHNNALTAALMDANRVEEKEAAPKETALVVVDEVTPEQAK